MTEKPKIKDTGFDVKLWLATHDWMYWVLAVGGVVGLVGVVWFVIKLNRKAKVTE
jgi:hypothetical protein